jgi:transcriptional regulator with XRE-family HTH domain
MRNDLGKIIKQRRLMIPLTLNELSTKSGVSMSHLARIERGERFPSAHALKKLASPLQFIDSELFTLAGYLGAEPSTQDTSIQEFPIVSFLKEVMRCRRRLPSQLAADLGVSHASVSRWLSGNDRPSTQSCQRLAEYSGVALEMVLSTAGHLPRNRMRTGPAEWPEFGEYAHRKYPNEFDEDEINMIEGLIERRREKRYMRTMS